MRTLIATASLLLPALAWAQDVPELDEQIRDRPDDVALRLERAEELLDQGRFDEALVDCELAAQLAPEDTSVALTRGRIHLAMGELGLAEADFTTYLKNANGNTEVYLLRGGVREETGRFKEALADYDAARVLVMKLPKERRTMADLLQLIDIEEGRARALERLGKKALAKTAREHAAHLKSLATPARDPSAT